MDKLTGKYSLIVCRLFLAVVVLVTIAGGKWKRHTVIKSDAAGYYVYLPATFIYHDVFDCSFYPEIDSTYNPADGVVYYGVQINHETNRIYFKYNYGIAAFELPLFYIAHLYAKATNTFKADGYSAPYQLAVALTTVLCSFFSLLVVRRFLLLYFSDIVAGITVFVIALGTNFFAQVITQPGISHIYLFLLFAVVLYSTAQLYKTFSWKYFLLLGAAMGLVIVIRPTDFLIGIFPLLWQAENRENRQGIKLIIKNNAAKIVCSVAIAFVIVFVQLLYWKMATGHWYYYTYRREYFDFGNWQIINGLFSYRKGWLLYTPLASLGFIGCFFAWRRKDLRFYVLPFTVYFIVTLYLVFCWWQWYYGGSFGCRVLVESLAVMALPIAALVEALLASPIIVRGVSLIIIALLVVLNDFQTVQYAKGVIHWQHMNKVYYWRVFGKLNAAADDKALLNNTYDLTIPATDEH